VKQVQLEYLMTIEDVVMDNYRKLLETLRLLAAPADIQLSQFPEMACRPDEIAFTLEEIVPLLSYLCQSSFITREVERKVKYIDNLFLTFSKSDWQENELYSSYKWQQVRNLANEILLKMGECWEIPNLFWISNLE